MASDFLKNNVSSEQIAIHTIQANHELLLGLNAAKGAQEQMHDDFPDLLGIAVEEGNLLQGNQSICDLIGSDKEDVIDHSLTQLFKKKSWKLIKKQFAKTDQNIFSLELPIDGVDSERLFAWTFSTFKAVSNRRGRLWSFVAKDITEQKQTANKLSAIFSAIPLGVLTINSKCEIDWPYSAYTEVLLGRDKLEGVDAKEGLFGKSLRFMSSQQLEYVENLVNLLGEDEDWFEMVHKQLPFEIPFAEEDGAIEPSHWRSLHYSPVVQNGIIEKILVVVEDITDRMRQRQELGQRLSKEQKVAQLIFDLQEIDKELLEPCMDDIQAYMVNLEKKSKDSTSVEEFCDVLHGIKGVARTVNLNLFKDFVHEMEARIMRNSEEIEKDSSKYFGLEFANLDEEWQEIKQYQSIIYGRSSDDVKPQQKSGISWEELEKRQNEILEKVSQLAEEKNLQADNGAYADLEKSLSYLALADLSSLSDKFAHLAEITAKRLDKKVRVEIDWNGNRIKQDLTSVLTEIITHILTNSIDHGIETPIARGAASKSEEGVISISAVEEGEQLHFTIKDDGVGIDADAVFKSAVKKGLITENANLERQEIFNLLLEKGFSTRDEATDISGRGIGLGAVDTRIKEHGGKEGLKIDSEQGKGTFMTFSLNYK